MPFLKRLGDHALSTKKLAMDNQKDFADCLHKFLLSVGGQNTILGSAGFASLFPPETAPTIRSSFNELIYTFNEAMGVKGPEVKSEVSDDSDHNAEDIPMVPVASGSVFGSKPAEDVAEEK
jgi:hypothetical protein